MSKQPQRQEIMSRDHSPALPVVERFREELSKMQPQFEPMLPTHIPADRFARVVMNAVQRTPRLLSCDRASLWNACMQSAEDGLLPDKREGAIVPFKKGKDDDGGSPGAAGDYVAVWIPMVVGVRKLVRNSGLLRDLNVQLVYVDENEQGAFMHELGAHPVLKHKRLPYTGDPAKRPVYCGYSLAWDREGNLLVPEVMFENEIMAVAHRSKSFAHGPWSDPLFSLEMRKKTLTKRHFKQLPTSRDLDRVLSRDDALYQFDRAAERENTRPTIPGGTKAALSHFASAGVDVPRASAAAAANDGEPAADAPESSGMPAQTGPLPETPDQYVAYFRSWLALMTDAGAANSRWKAEQDMRLDLKPEITNDLLKTIKGELDARIAELRK